MSTHFPLAGWCLGGILGLAVALPGGAAPRPGAVEETSTLRYGWKAGQNLVYRVEIEADHGEYLETLAGTPAYTVKSVDADGIKVTFRGGLRKEEKLKPGVRGILRPRPPFPFSPYKGVGSVQTLEMTLNERGQVITASDGSQLPYLLGNLAELVLVPLAPDSKKTWSRSREITITVSSGRLPRVPVGPRPSATQLKAVEEIGYTLDELTAGQATISRKLDLHTIQTIAGKPRIEITGEGKLTFDRKQGTVTELKLTHKVIFREAAQTNEVPLTITGRLLSEEEKKELAKTAEAAPIFPEQPLGDDLEKKALADLTSGEQGRQLRALSLLQIRKPAKPNKEVADALAALLAGNNKLLHFPASRALVKWAVPETAPALLEALKMDSAIVRHAAMEALGELKVEKAAPAIAARLTENADRLSARKVLESMGGVAEPAVLEQAGHAEWMVRLEVCRVLTKIGTQKSLPTLTRMADGDANALVKRTAGQAAQTIRSRQ